ncbi:hypothetical protein X975_14215, partial [Stegodyphus mimosarum]
PSETNGCFTSAFFQNLNMIYLWRRTRKKIV